MGESFHDAIVREVSAWPGVTTGRHRFGGTEFRYGRRELGHLHGGRVADLPFPLLVRNDLVAAGRAERPSRPSGVRLGELLPPRGVRRPPRRGAVSPQLRAPLDRWPRSRHSRGQIVILHRNTKIDHLTLSPHGAKVS